jgi:hypothetical protein
MPGWGLYDCEEGAGEYVYCVIIGSQKEGHDEAVAELFHPRWQPSEFPILKDVEVQSWLICGYSILDGWSLFPCCYSW